MSVSLEALKNIPIKDLDGGQITELDQEGQSYFSNPKLSLIRLIEGHGDKTYEELFNLAILTNFYVYASPLEE